MKCHYWLGCFRRKHQGIVIALASSWRRRRGAKTLTFSNISVITEDIYLKPRIVVPIKRGTHTSRGGNPPIFLSKLCPFFDLEFSKCSYSQALAPACGALVFGVSGFGIFTAVFSHRILTSLKMWTPLLRLCLCTF